MESKYLIVLCALFVVQVQCQNASLLQARKLRALGDDITTVINDIKKIRDQTMPIAIDEIGKSSQKLANDSATTHENFKKEISSEVTKYVTNVEEMTKLGVKESCTKNKIQEIKTKDAQPLTDLQICADTTKNSTGTITSAGIKCLLDLNKNVTNLESDRVACKEDMACLVKVLMAAEQLKDEIKSNLEQCPITASKDIEKKLNSFKICGRKQLAAVTLGCVTEYNKIFSCA